MKNYILIAKKDNDEIIPFKVYGKIRVEKSYLRAKFLAHLCNIEMELPKYQRLTPIQYIKAIKQGIIKDSDDICFYDYKQGRYINENN